MDEYRDEFTRDRTTAFLGSLVVPHDMRLSIFIEHVQALVTVIGYDPPDGLILGSCT